MWFGTVVDRSRLLSLIGKSVGWASSDRIPSTAVPFIGLVWRIRMESGAISETLLPAQSSLVGGSWCAGPLCDCAFGSVGGCGDECFEGPASGGECDADSGQDGEQCR